MPEDLAGVLEETFRREWPALVGAAARITGDLDRAEEIAQDVLVTALDRWPFSGIPERPGAWLLTAARNRARNCVRDDARARAREQKAAVVDAVAAPSGEAEPIGDDRLRLLFACCHPVLTEEARVALTLRMVGGLSTGEIARAFLVPVATMAQRLVRAKRTLSDAKVGFAIPEPTEWAARLPGVRAVIYLVFNEGYSAASGAALTRPVLCAEGLRMAGLLAELLPGEAEVQGLAGLLALQSARLGTRADDDGELVLLQFQDRSRWDRRLVRRGEEAIDQALRIGPPGPLTLQAMIAACHTRAPSWEATDWAVIVALYDQLFDVNPSPVVALNRAVAVSMVCLEEAWTVLQSVTAELANYPPLWAARADVLRRLGRAAEASTDYRRAASLGTNEPEYRFLLTQADDCSGQRGQAS